MATIGDILGVVLQSPDSVPIDVLKELLEEIKKVNVKTHET